MIYIVHIYWLHNVAYLSIVQFCNVPYGRVKYGVVSIFMMWLWIDESNVNWIVFKISSASDMLRPKQCQDPTWTFSFEFHQGTRTFFFSCPKRNGVFSIMPIPIQQPPVAELMNCLDTNSKLGCCFRRSFFFSSPSAFSFLILSCICVQPGWFAKMTLYLHVCMSSSSRPSTAHSWRAKVLWTFDQFFLIILTMTMHEVSDSVHLECIHNKLFH